ncbi:hypothetical protein HG535_0B04590 [Zygotorulaspora mrakii]|uniref:Eukaryotic translation initiation factor 3 subunit J n=1 Tax=Zygotorulaspora mrakii TaxID=42260 RepID=A0A7H9AZ24_ZYGMR|nr:uncharacterized protein HG535_0B04590 [Zygotorulaspora mrakii]QLG71417.1 hypothetical protein HG535_0B04590 [Zygotorulaspora mrakii]
MSWDDDLIGGSAAQGEDAVLMDSWDAELTDEPVMDSWDAEEEVEDKPKAKPKATSKASGKKKPNGKEVVNPLMAIDTLDEKTRKELIKKAEIESDLNNAADLFSGLGVAEEHPRAAALRREQEAMEIAKISRPALTKESPIEDHPLFKDAETKADYQDLRKSLTTAIVSMHEKSSLNYASSLAVDLIRDIAKPMSIENIRQTIATLNIMMKDKERQERQARLAKVKGGTATGGAGKKKAKGGQPNLGGAFKKDQQFDMGGAEYDDFNDDDFM